MRKTAKWTLLFLPFVFAASLARASLVFYMSFEDADGKRTLFDRISPTFRCHYTGQFPRPGYGTFTDEAAPVANNPFARDLINSQPETYRVGPGLVMTPKTSYFPMTNTGARVTMAMWIYLYPDEEVRSLSARGLASAQNPEQTLGWAWFVDPADQNAMKFSFWSQPHGDLVTVTSSTQIPLTNWTHVALSWEAGVADSLKMYVNGTSVPVSASPAATALCDPPTCHLHFGVIDAASLGPLNGRIDEICMYDEILPPHEIAALTQGVVIPTTFYVATNGNDAASGDYDHPWRSLSNSANRVAGGSTLVVRGGEYREEVVVNNSTLSPTNRLTIMAYENEVPVIKASDVATTWTLDSGSVWKTTWSVKPQQVFVDGAPLQMIGPINAYFNAHPSRCTQIGTDRNDMYPGTFFYDTQTQTLYVWLEDGSNPSSHLMEVSRRAWCLNAPNGCIVLRGLHFRHGNTCTFRDTGNQVDPGPNSLVEDCDLQWGDFTGIFLRNNTRVLRCNISRHGNSGVGGNTQTNVYIAQCTVISNNYRIFAESWHCGGMKLIPNVAGIIESNEVAWNRGQGIWLDGCRSGKLSVIRDNYVHHNSGAKGGGEGAVMVEISSNAVVCNNLIVSNANSYALYISASRNVRCYNNTLIKNSGIYAIGVLGVPRETGDGEWELLANNEVFNNVVWNHTGTRELGVATDSEYAFNNTVDYNVYYREGGGANWWYQKAYASFAEWQRQNPKQFDQHSLYIDPRMNDQGQLELDSPCIDAGIWTPWLAHDRLGRARPQDGNADGIDAYDIGAHEIEPLDSDGDGLPDAYEAAHGLDPFRKDADEDLDGDGMSNYAEYRAGTRPNDAASVLQLDNRADPSDEDTLVLQWPSVSNRLYRVESVERLAEEFTTQATGLPATPPVNVFTSPVPANCRHRVYRVVVEVHAADPEMLVSP